MSLKDLIPAFVILLIAIVVLGAFQAGAMLGQIHIAMLTDHNAAAVQAQREHTTTHPHEGDSALACDGGLTTD